MLTEIREKPFNVYTEMQLYLDSLNISGKYGATVNFVGTMRDFNEDKKVTHMILEHYPGMTEKHLETVAKEAVEKWNLLDILILHRVGKVKISENIVLIATWSAHRKAAFKSCRTVMEQLKSTVPFWKKEETTSGAQWVEKNTPGY